MADTVNNCDELVCVGDEKNLEKGGNKITSALGDAKLSVAEVDWSRVKLPAQVDNTVSLPLFDDEARSATNQEHLQTKLAQLKGNTQEEKMIGEVEELLSVAEARRTLEEPNPELNKDGKSLIESAPKNLGVESKLVPKPDSNPLSNWISKEESDVIFHPLLRGSGCPVITTSESSIEDDPLILTNQTMIFESSPRVTKVSSDDEYGDTEDSAHHRKLIRNRLGSQLQSGFRKTGRRLAGSENRGSLGSFSRTSFMDLSYVGKSPRTPRSLAIESHPESWRSPVRRIPGEKVTIMKNVFDERASPRPSISNLRLSLGKGSPRYGSSPHKTTSFAKSPKSPGRFKKAFAGDKKKGNARGKSKKGDESEEDITGESEEDEMEDRDGRRRSGRHPDDDDDPDDIPDNYFDSESDDEPSTEEYWKDILARAWWNLWDAIRYLMGPTLDEVVLDSHHYGRIVKEKAEEAYKSYKGETTEPQDDSDSQGEESASNRRLLETIDETETSLESEENSEEDPMGCMGKMKGAFKKKKKTESPSMSKSVSFSSVANERDGLEIDELGSSEEEVYGKYRVKEEKD